MTTIRAAQSAPAPDAEAARQAARAFRRGGVLAALQALHASLGDVFQLPLPGFRSVVMVGPEATRFVLTEEREGFLWRSEGDPVTRLLRRGVLVTDGAEHDALRGAMTPALHKRLFEGFSGAVGKSADRLSQRWRDGASIPLLEEMRHIALLSLMDTVYDEDFAPRAQELLPDIERTVRYISPGPWLVWRGIPRLGYRHALRRMDAYFYDLIARRRASGDHGADLVSLLLAAGLDDERIRDQLLTMFIAGHDTSTALLAWSLALLAHHPEALARAQAEVDTALGGAAPSYTVVRQLPYLDRVIKEALRLYPPIHLGSRIAARDISYGPYQIPAGTRVLYSIFLTHRDARYWPAADDFDPDRFAPERAGERPSYAYIPFGGGPRNCIGAAFAQMEAKIILARLLQRYTFRPARGGLRARMRATLEPHPHMRLVVTRRQRDGYVAGQRGVEQARF